MNSITRKSDSSQLAAETAVYLFDDWFDPIETGVRDRVREFIQAMVEGELDAALMRPQSDRKSTRLNSSHANISYAVFCLKKKKRMDQSHLSFARRYM